jgi:hypothetical protein
VTALVLIGFLLHPVHHVDPAWFAVLGAIVLCVCDKPMEVEKVVEVSFVVLPGCTAGRAGVRAGVLPAGVCVCHTLVGVERAAEMTGLPFSKLCLPTSPDPPA